jgi:cytochrome P450
MRDLANALVTRRLAAPEHGGRPDLRWFADEFVAAIVNAIIGLPQSDDRRIREWTGALVTLWMPTVSTATKLEAVATLVTSRPYLAELIAQRRAHPESYQDLIADLATSRDPALSDDEILANVLASRIAGLDTTRDTITSTVRLMLDTGWWLHAAQAHRRDSARIINRCRDETLRRYTPHRGLCRVTTREARIGGVVLPAGAVVLVSFGAANLDPTVFDDPLVVNINRPNIDHHLAFGSGAHVCGGKGLALAEITTALEILANRLPHLTLADNDDRTYTPSLHFYGLARLNVRLTASARTQQSALTEQTAD